MASRAEKCAIAGMVFGIASIPLTYPWPIGLASAVIGAVLSCFGLRSRRRGMAIAGLVCSIVVLSLMVVGAYLQLGYMRSHPGAGFFD